MEWGGGCPCNGTSTLGVGEGCGLAEEGEARGKMAVVVMACLETSHGRW